MIALPRSPLALARMLGGLGLCAVLTGCSDEKLPPNVVVITIESLRTDHVSFQDGEKLTTPQLAQLADEGVVYTDAHSVTSWTLASHASLFTGLYPRAHATVAPKSALGNNYTTLAEALADGGYQTAGVASGPYLRRAHNLQQGFEIYDDSLSSDTHAQAHDDQTNPGMLARMRKFLNEERDPERPFFLFGYFWDPHYDYLPPPPWDRKFANASDRRIDLRGYEAKNVLPKNSHPDELAFALSQYDGEIGYTDETIGKLFATLRELELWDNTLIVVTSDHGEEFYEHGEKGHKNNLHAESLHVPLVVKYPREGVRAKHRGRDRRIVSLIDIYPTVMEVVGLAPKNHLQGRSLLEPMPPTDREIFFELLSIWFRKRADGSTHTDQQQWFGVRRGRYKLLEIQPSFRRMLYDIRTDPIEEIDLLDSEADLPDGLRALPNALRKWGEEMDRVRETYGSANSADLSPAELKRLEDLGYL